MTRTRQPNRSTSSAIPTQTQVETPAQQTTSGTLRLRAEATATGEQDEPAEERRIRWAEDVVDNEGQGKKSSKVCCIYHKPRAVGESSSESDSSESDSDSDSESGRDTGEARMAGDRSRKPHRHSQDRDAGKPANKKKPRVNAYERVPKHHKNTRA